jgi:hypothetical protein
MFSRLRHQHSPSRRAVSRFLGPYDYSGARYMSARPEAAQQTTQGESSPSSFEDVALILAYKPVRK